MSEKTIEELEAELERLRKENLERLIEEERKKKEEAEELKKKEAEEALIQEGYKRAMEEMKSKSNVTEDKPTTLEANTKFEVFKQAFVKKHNLSGKPYEEFIKEKVDGIYS